MALSTIIYLFYATKNFQKLFLEKKWEDYEKWRKWPFSEIFFILWKTNGQRDFQCHQTTNKMYPLSLEDQLQVIVLKIQSATDCWFFKNKANISSCNQQTYSFLLEEAGPTKVTTLSSFGISLGHYEFVWRRVALYWFIPHVRVATRVRHRSTNYKSQRCRFFVKKQHNSAKIQLKPLRLPR